MKKKILFTLISILLPLSLWAQGGTHWQCDENTSNNMQVFLIVELEGTELTTVEQLKDIEVAAFCGEECRGVVSGSEFQTAGAHKVLQMMIHSNIASGETITFKAYLKNTNEEVDVKSTSIAFNDTEGNTSTPSNPLLLKVKPPYTPGDVNGDDIIDTEDVQLTFEFFMGQEMGSGFVQDAADFNGDGLVDTEDVQLIFEFFMNQ